MKNSIASVLVFALPSLLNAQVTLDWARCGFEDSVHGAVFSSDGQTLYINDFYSVKAVDTKTGNLLASVYDSNIAVGDPWIAADKWKLRYCTWFDAVEVDMKTGGKLRTRFAMPRSAGRDGNIRPGFFAFSPDSSRITMCYTGFGPGMVYDRVRNGPLTYLNSTTIEGSNFSPDGKYAVVPGFDTLVCDAQTGFPVSLIKGFATEAYWCPLRDRSWVAVKGDIYDVATNPPTLVYSSGVGSQIKFSVDGNTFAYARNGIKVFDTKTRQPVGQVTENEDGRITLGPQTGMVFRGGRFAKLYDWRTNEVVCHVADFAAPTLLTVSGSGNKVAFRGAFRWNGIQAEGFVFLDGTSGATLAGTNPGPWERERHMLSHNGTTMLEIRENPFRFITYNAASGSKLSEILSQVSSYPIACLSPDGKKYAVTYSSSTRLDVFDAQTGQLVQTTDDPRFRDGVDMTWSPDGNKIGIGQLQNLLVIDASSLDVLSSYNVSNGWQSKIAFDSTGARLFRSYFAGVYHVTTVDMSTGQTSTVDAGQNPVSLAPDGQRFAALGANREVEIFSTDTGAKIYSYSDPLQTVGLVREVQIRADGQHVFVARDDGPVMSFKAP